MRSWESVALCGCRVADLWIYVVVESRVRIVPNPHGGGVTDFQLRVDASVCPPFRISRATPAAHSIGLLTAPLLRHKDPLASRFTWTPLVSVYRVSPAFGAHADDGPTTRWVFRSTLSEIFLGFRWLIDCAARSKFSIDERRSLSHRGSARPTSLSFRRRSCASGTIRTTNFQ